MSYLPFAFDGNVVRLPTNVSFCVKNDDGITQYVTNQDGARIIEPEKKETGTLVAFGESQLLEIFPSTRNRPHALSKLFPEDKLILYAAPNNGPKQVLFKLENFEKFNDKDHYWVGFNFGTDPFRLSYAWKVERFVLFRKNDLKNILKYPSWYEARMVFARLFDKKFTSSRPDKNIVQKMYLKWEKLIERNIKNYLKSLGSIASRKKIRLNIILYVPYWVYKNTNGTVALYPVYKKRVKQSVCKTFGESSGALGTVVVAQLKLGVEYHNTFTASGRHYRNTNIKFSSIDRFCST